MKTPIFVGVLLLAGCGTAPLPAETVYVPVHAPCIRDKPVTPVYEFDKLPLNAQAGEKVLALARDWLIGRKYEGKLEAALAGCVQDLQQ